MSPSAKPVKKRGGQKGLKDVKKRKSPSNSSLPENFDVSSRKFRKELIRSLIREGRNQKKGISPMTFVAQAFYKDQTAMLTILKHILPQLKAVELKTDEKSPFKLFLTLGGKQEVVGEDDDES